MDLDHPLVLYAFQDHEQFVGRLPRFIHVL
jgi:hypothetical protein